MKHLLLFFLFITLQVTNAQTYNWSDLFGGDGFDFSNIVAMDDEGNVYNSGFYREGNFEIGDTVLPFVDNMDTYLAKFSAAGELLWVVPMYGTGLFDRTEGMFLDDNGDVYLLSLIQEEFNIGDQQQVVIPAENNTDIILMKFSPDGDLYWYKTFSGPGSDVGYNMAYNGSEIIMVGHFYDTLYMDSDTLVSTSQDMFVASLDMNGNINWAKSYGGSGSDRLHAVDFYGNGDLAVCGYSFGGFEFGGILLDSVDGVLYHAFVARLDDLGNPIWVAMMLNDFRTQASDITVDPSYNAYIAFSDQYYKEFQIASYTSDGLIAWKYKSENSTDTLTALAYDVQFADWRLYVSGYLSKGNIFYGKQYDEIQNTDFLLAKIKPGDGTLDTLFHDGGAGKLKAYGLFIDDNGNAALPIVADGQVTVGGSDLGHASDDIVLVSLDISELMVGADEHSPESEELVLYPNPVYDRLSFKGYQGQEFEQVIIYDQLGRQVAVREFNESLEISELKPGHYLLRLTGKQNPVTIPFVKK